MPKFIILLLCFFIIPNSYAIDSVTLKVNQVKTQNWQFNNVMISLIDIEKKSPQLQLSIAQLLLPKPFNDLKFLNINCRKFNWGNNEIHCWQGTAQLQSKQFNSPRCQFSFHITKSQSQFQIQQLKLLEGLFNFQGIVQKNHWQLNLNGKQIGLTVLHDLLFPQLKLSSGTFNLIGNVQGNQQGLTRVKIQTQTNHLSLQTTDGAHASEALSLDLNLTAIKKPHNWLWESNNVFQQGNLYSEPLYLENKSIPITLHAQGYWYEKQQQLLINSAKFNHPTLGFITANAVINLKTKPALKTVNFYLNIADLAAASPIYLAPFISSTAIDGISLSGQFESGITFKDKAVSNAYLISNHFTILDKKQRFNLENGILSVNWSNQENLNKTSMLFWQKFNLFGVPIEQSYFTFLLKKQSLRLLTETHIPLLQGQLQIKQFDWQTIQNKAPKVHFSGKIQQLSLQQLSQIFNWHPLPGYISGNIPSVNFAEGKLNLDGGLIINAFDGEIAINKLALSGVMSDFSQFYSDIELKNLDLDLLTQQFSLGGMQGRISGYIKDLYLENGLPITFNAWLGTPENDDSVHQISQKAVENLASIGGGGMVDLLSRTVLSVFDNFDYDKLGLGCQLSHGVCQLTGVEAANYGYYIVKGGGLPRIDVMGYNPQIDWAVLQERLQRITQSSSNALIK